MSLSAALFNDFQFHAAFAAPAVGVGYRIAGAGAAAVAKMNSGSFEVDPLGWAAAETFFRIIRVKTGTPATFSAPAENGLGAFHLHDVTPLQRCPAGAASRPGADSSAWALRITVASVEDIVPYFSEGLGMYPGTCGQ